MKPVARLYITRQKVYEKECDINDETETQIYEESFSDREVEETYDKSEVKELSNPIQQRRFKANKCATTKYVEATSCSVTCGTGLKTLRR